MRQPAAIDGAYGPSALVLWLTIEAAVVFGISVGLAAESTNAGAFTVLGVLLFGLTVELWATVSQRRRARAHTAGTSPT